MPESVTELCPIPTDAKSCTCGDVLLSKGTTISLFLLSTISTKSPFFKDDLSTLVKSVYCDPSILSIKNEDLVL